MKSLFEEMGGTYRQVGDYFIPNLVLPDDGEYQIGKYGRMRRSYLKEHRKNPLHQLCDGGYAVQASVRDRSSLQRARGKHHSRYGKARGRNRSTQSG
jgi:hypothetical protein